jgi:hypothetical protein
MLNVIPIIHTKENSHRIHTCGNEKIFKHFTTRKLLNTSENSNAGKEQV